MLHQDKKKQNLHFLASFEEETQGIIELILLIGIEDERNFEMGQDVSLQEIEFRSHKKVRNYYYVP